MVARGVDPPRVSPVPIHPDGVPTATVRRLSVAAETPQVVRHLQVSRVPSPLVVPRQIDPVGLRLMALMLENDELRAELDQLRTG